jgi:DNA primase
MSQRNSRNGRAIQEIKARLNMVDVVRRYVELRRVGPRWMAPCPFHQETKPSFSVNEEEGFFYCFGCQAAGDLFDFYGRINGLDFRETLEQLAEEAGVQLDASSSREDRRHDEALSRKRRILRMHDLAARHFSRNLTLPQGRECREYMERRGISESMIERFDLGFSLPEWQDLTAVLRRAGFADALGVEAALLGASDKGGQKRTYDRFRGRLMFPIRALGGRVIAFGGRIIPVQQKTDQQKKGEDEAKYINSGDSPIYKKGEHLYGLAQARRAVSQQGAAMLTEGYMDVVTLHQFGYEQAVGVLGTALTPEQIKRLSGFTANLELLFDGDRAGRKAALRACEMILPLGLACKVVLFPEQEDIDSLLRGQGKEAFEALRATAQGGLDFCIQTLRGMAPRDAVDWAKNFLRRITLPELISRYASQLATGLGLNEEELRGRFTERARLTGRVGDARGPGATAPHKNRSDLRDQQIMTFAVRYPHALERLRAAGGHAALVTPRAKALWAKLENCDPGTVALELDDKEKRFWIVCRTESAPLTNEEGELAALCRMLERNRRDRTPFAAALRRNTADPEADGMYLQALQQTLKERNRAHALHRGEKTDGEH